MVTFQKPLLPFITMVQQEEKAGSETMKLDSAQMASDMPLTSTQEEGREAEKATPAPQGEVMRHPHNRVPGAYKTLTGYEHWVG